MKDIYYDNINKGRLGNQLWILSAGLEHYDGTNTLYCNDVPENIEKMFPLLSFEPFETKNENSITICGYQQVWSQEREDKMQKYCVFSKYEGIKHPDDLTIIHVRRGDYLTGINPSLYITLSPLYIKNTVQKYGFNKHIIVISDDIQWCRKNLTFLPLDTLYSTGTVMDDLYLMTIAKNIICSGSSLSIIGCVLNKRKDKLCIGITPYWKVENEPWEAIYPDYFTIEDYKPYL